MQPFGVVTGRAVAIVLTDTLLGILFSEKHLIF